MEDPTTYVGIRELKSRATEVIRRVREEGAEYVITYYGKPVARLSPIADALPPDPDGTARLFAEIDALASEIGRLWPAGEMAVKAVREVRREL